MQVKPRILLTGATGFLGSNLARTFVRQGVPLAILVRPCSNITVLGDIISGLKMYTWDGSYATVRAAIADFKPDVVVHVASMIQSEHKSTDIPELFAANITYGSYLLEAMAVSGVKHIINTGTFWQHYKKQPYLPVNLYAATKQAFCDILEYYTDACGIKAISMELFDTYGVNDTRKKIIPLLLHAWRTGETLDMSPGEQEIMLVHIDDVCMAYIKAIELIQRADYTGHRKYAISHGTPIQLQALVKLIGVVTGKSISACFGKRPYRVREVMQVCTGPILPNWNPNVDLHEGIRRTFYRSL
jgi:nucleoside-diphosphate-sugar epimerase